MKHSKFTRILSLLLVLVLACGLLSGISLTASAADPYEVEKELTLNAGQEYSGITGRIYLSDDFEKFGSPIDKVEKGYAQKIPDGMYTGTNDAFEFYLYGTPQNPGFYASLWNVTLQNGMKIKYWLYVTVKAKKVIDAEQNVVFTLDEKPSTYYLDVAKYKDEHGGYLYKELVDEDALPPGMSSSLGGEPDAPYIYNAPTGAGTFHPKWRIVMQDGTLINLTMNIKVEPKKTLTSSQDVTLKVYEDPGRVTMAFDNDDFVKYCHLAEGELPWPMEWHYGGEPDRPYLSKMPQISGEFKVVFEITLYDGTLFKHTMNITVEANKVYNSSQMVSLTVGEYARVYFDVDKYTETSGYVGCELVEGELPPGMEWMAGEVDPPRIYGTAGIPIETRAKEQFARDDYTGTYVSKWKICTGDGIQINHTLTCVLTKDGNPFVDVKDSDYFFKAVLWAVTHDPQVTNGIDLTHFGPGKTCTRGQVVTFLWRAAGCPEPTSSKNPFVDVKESDYFYDAVLWAVENEITNGMDPTHFGPATGCTRGQVVTFLWRAEGKPEPTSSENPFKDVKSDDYYYLPVLWAVEQGITNGTSANTFSPKATCTRGQIVTFLYRDMGPVNGMTKAELLMYVEDVMTIADRGVVISGRIASGKVKTGDKIRLIGSVDGGAKNDTYTVESIEMFHKLLDEAEAGDNVGILLGNVDKTKIARGDAMVAEKSDLIPVTKLHGTLELTSRYDGGRHNPINDGYKPQFYVSTNDVTGTITGLPSGTLEPAQTAWNVNVELINPTFVYTGQEIAVREGGRTVGVFKVTSIEK